MLAAVKRSRDARAAAKSWRPETRLEHSANSAVLSGQKMLNTAALGVWGRLRGLLGKGDGSRAVTADPGAEQGWATVDEEH